MNPHLLNITTGLLFIVVFGTVVAGLQQGGAQENIRLSWGEVVSFAVPYTAGMAVAWIFIFVSNLFFFFHLTLMGLRLGKRSLEPTLLG